MEKNSFNHWHHRGVGEDILIKKLSLLVKWVVGYQGEIVFDCSKPGGTMRKLIDVAMVNRMGWTYATPLEAGLRVAYQDFINYQ